jgi:uncharacterized membrane protein
MSTVVENPLPFQSALLAGRRQTHGLVFTAIVTQVIGNAALSRGMHEMGSVVSLSPLPCLRALLNPWIAGGVLVLAFWMFSNLTLLSRADLSYVLPVTAVSYVLIAIVGQLLLHERVHALRWSGIAMITFGVMLVGGTPARTTPAIVEGQGK